jgi:hypothetical protein
MVLLDLSPSRGCRMQRERPPDNSFLAHGMEGACERDNSTSAATCYRRLLPTALIRCDEVAVDHTSPLRTGHDTCCFRLCLRNCSTWPNDRLVLKILVDSGSLRGKGASTRQMPAPEKRPTPTSVIFMQHSSKKQPVPFFITLLHMPYPESRQK